MSYNTNVHYTIEYIYPNLIKGGLFKVSMVVQNNTLAIGGQLLMTIVEEPKNDTITELIKKIKQEKRSLKEKMELKYKKLRCQSLQELKDRGYSENFSKKKISFIERRFDEKINNLSTIFDEFVITDPKTIEFGSKARGGFRICKYGETDRFRNAIWIHTHSVEELQTEFPEYQKELAEYVDNVRKYYRLVAHGL